MDAVVRDCCNSAALMCLWRGAEKVGFGETTKSSADAIAGLRALRGASLSESATGSLELGDVGGAIRRVPIVIAVDLERPRPRARGKALGANSAADAAQFASATLSRALSSILDLGAHEAPISFSSSDANADAAVAATFCLPSQHLSSSVIIAVLLLTGLKWYDLNSCASFSIVYEA